jgi:LysR family nitrogen assimilation transcriptional regulator
MELREIRYFTQVARSGSFSAAALELRIAQPALSRKVRKLEKELGVDLLVRHGRGIRLTEAGSSFLKNAEAIDHLVRQSSDQVKAKATAPIGHAALGVPPAAGLLVVPPVIERFRADWPLVSLHIREGISTSLQEWLLDRRIDVALLHNPPPLQAIEAVPVLTERMVVIGPSTRRGGRADPRPHLRIRDLADLPLIMPSLPHNNRRLLEQAAVQHGVNLSILFEVDSVGLTKQLVSRGLGYSVIAASAVREEVARGLLRAIPIERPALTATIAIATPHGAQPSAFVSDLIAKLRDTVRDLVRSGVWANARYLG